jgi:hypothetical protein
LIVQPPLLLLRRGVLRSYAIGQWVTLIEASVACEVTPDVDSSQRARVSSELGTVPILHEIIERK